MAFKNNMALINSELNKVHIREFQIRSIWVQNKAFPTYLVSIAFWYLFSFFLLPIYLSIYFFFSFFFSPQAIEECLKDQTKVDVEELENRNYETMANPSLLRFLVDMRGEDTTNIQVHKHV